MKKIYSQPELTVHGNVEALTQALGPSLARDFIIVGGATLPINDADGSRNFVL